jgi:hypothetical protein
MLVEGLLWRSMGTLRVFMNGCSQLRATLTAQTSQNGNSKIARPSEKEMH